LGHYLGRLGIVICLAFPPLTWGQLPPLGVPRGVVRVELDGSLETFDRRFRDGRLESYAADLASPALGSDRIPLLANTDAAIGRIIGNSSYRLNLGAYATDAHADVGTGFFGVGLGLTNGITIFGRIPLVRTRVQSFTTLDPTGADGGLNPGATEQLPFFTEFDAALGTLASKLAAGDYDANPTQKALAQATLADATSLRADLFGVLADPTTESPALPTTTSGAGTALTARITALQNTLASNLNVTGFTLAPALPETVLTKAEFPELLSRLNLRESQSPVSFRGDAEVGAAVTLVDRWDRGARRGGLRTAVSGLVRLPTGRRELSDRLLDIGTGDGQTDIQVDLVADIGSGPIGTRLTGSYIRQLPTDITTRVTSPDQPLVGPDRVALVRWNPGDIIALGVRPFYRLARTLAVQVGVQHWSRGADAASYASPIDAIPGVDAGILATDSKVNATLLSVGITYSNPGGLRPGGKGLPVEASWSYERVLRSGGGRTPDTHAVRGSFRVYFGIW
jgi:hypothetical protein